MLARRMAACGKLLTTAELGSRSLMQCLWPASAPSLSLRRTQTSFTWQRANRQEVAAFLSQQMQAPHGATQVLQNNTSSVPSWWIRRIQTSLLSVRLAVPFQASRAVSSKQSTAANRGRKLSPIRMAHLEWRTLKLHPKMREFSTQL